MKKFYLFLSFILLFFMGQNYVLAQAPTLGTTANFALFTAVGAFSNTGATTIIGDVGTNVGAFTGFPPGVVIGDIHVANSTSAQAATDAEIAYNSMNPITCGIVLTTPLGNGQILTPDVYCIGMAATLNGELILDGEGDPNAIFIFKIDGAFATSTLSSITLINSASLCNVYWQINGEFTLGEGSSFLGTVLVNGAINLLEESTLDGRAISRSGAVSTHNNIVTISEVAEPSVIIANGPTSFCLGGSVTLSGNINGVWNTGETTNSIVVNVSGDYYVTNSTNCGDTISNVLSIIEFQLPICNITGSLNICLGQTTTLCAPAGNIYIWNTNETTNCIIVDSSGIFSVTITDINGCTSMCEVEVEVGQQLECTIAVSPTFCVGGSTELCVPTGFTSYLWSTGESTNCISVNTDGLYSVTITDISGCISTCEVELIAFPQPLCDISGSLFICEGQSAEICAPEGLSAYLWSTGETTACITINIAGIYSVTVTSNNGCTNTGEIEVIASPSPICNISGPVFICQGQSSELCAPIGFSYLWSTGEITSCITINISGIYSVTMTDIITGCSSSCEVEAIFGSEGECLIQVLPNFCVGGSTELCVPAGFNSYLWSTGESTSCISVTSDGIYSVTITDSTGCSSTCEIELIATPLPICDIIGSVWLCEGQSSELCAPEGLTSYLWSTGETTACIIITIAGTYSVTITDITGCTNTGEIEVIAAPLPVCSINGPLVLCEGQSSELCVPIPSGSNCLWSTGETTSCISIASVGIYSVTITGVDGCSSSCEVEVLAESLIPEIQCPIAITIQCDEILLPINTGEARSLDVCGITPTITYVDSILSGNCANEITIIREWIATDPSGNSSNCIQIIEVIDTIIPVILCPPNLIKECDLSNLPIITGFATAIDKCDTIPAITFADVMVVGNCPQQITITRTWTSTDACGNSSSCAQTIESIDNTLPVITCPINITIQCNLNILPPNTGIAVATDNCDLNPSISFNDILTSGNCPQQFSVERMWIATDACGNTSSCIQTINSVDNTAPVIVCPISITIQCDEDNLPANTGLATATDNCDLSPSITYSDSIINGSCLQESFISRIWTATDDCGNSAICTQVISIIDTLSPEITINHPFYGLYQNGDIISIQCESNTPGWDIPSINPLNDIIMGDNCSEDISIEFSENNIIGDCINNGFLLQRELLWTATDECGNTGSFLLTINIVDNIAPQLLGVPDDITLNCDAIPVCKDTLSCGSYQPNWAEFITVQDECECASIEFEEQIFEGNCSGQYYMLWIWTATDNCGNFTRDTQRVTFLNELGPIFEAINQDLAHLNNGDTLEVECHDSGLPQWIYGLNKSDFNAYDRCSGNPLTTSFSNEFLGYSNCAVSGYLQESQLTWFAADDCGLTSSFSVIIRLVDTLAPEIEGNWEEIACIGDFDINSISVNEGCSGFIHEISEVPHPSYCMDGEDDILRKLTLIDGCNNRSTYEQVVLASYPGPSFSWNLPNMSHLQNGDTIQVNCNIQNSLSMSGFRKRDMQILANCSNMGSRDFYEEFVELGDCNEEDFLSLIRVIWSGTDSCGIQNTFVIYAKVTDSVPPVILADAILTLGCADSIPVPIITDNCSEVDFTITELTRTLVPCPDYMVITREIVAEDACGNISRMTQEIRISSDTDMMGNMESVVCVNDNILPLLPSFTDNCTGEQMIPQIIELPFNDECGANRGVRRTIALTNSCGVRQEMTQTIIFQDTITPVIVVFVPGHGFLNNGDVIELECGEDEVFFTLENASIDNNCIGDEIQLEISENVSEDCLLDGYLKRIRYMWLAKDACGHTSTFGISVIYRDTRSPEFTFVPDNQLIICDTAPPIQQAIAFDDCTLIDMAFNEQHTQLDNNNTIILRNWVATDECGNSATASQTIEVRTTTNFGCDISLLDSLICNSDSIHFRAIPFGGRGPYIYQWRVEGGSCVIEYGQGTPNVTISNGYTKITVYLTITDINGCVSECIFEQECSPIFTKQLGDKIFDQAAAYPNPAQDVIYFVGHTLYDGNIKIQIHDGFGVQHQQEDVYLRKGENYTLSTDISRFVSGLFYIQVIHENGLMEIHKVLKY